MILYFHGLRSSPTGTKAQFFKDQIPGLVVPDFGYDLSVKDLPTRVKMAEEFLEDDTIILGSSLGGFLAATVATRNPNKVRGLFLINPALRLGEMPNPQCKTFVVVGDSDTVVAPEAAREFAKTGNRRIAEIVGGDHQLHANTAELMGYLRNFLAEFDVAFAQR